MKLAFAGSPYFAANILQAIIAQNYSVVSVLTQPDRPAGRGQRMQPSAVKQVAQLAGLPVYEPDRLTGIAPHELMSVRPDLLLVVAYGLLLPRPWLEWSACGAVNVHTSLLPRWRGAAPIERAIMAGDQETGVSLMQMEVGLDTGPLLSCLSCTIDGEDTAVSLEHKLTTIACTLLLDLLSEYAINGCLPAGEPQPSSGIIYAHKITHADALIDWSASAKSIVYQVRALAGRSGAVTFIMGQERLRIHAVNECALSAQEQKKMPGTIIQADKNGIWVQCGSGVLNLLQMRLNRGKGGLLGYKDAINGFADLFAPGTLLGMVNNNESRQGKE